MKVISLLIFILSIAPSAWSFIGGEDTSSGTRGGGNHDVKFFYDEGDLILSRLLPRSPIQIDDQKIDISHLIEVFKNTRVIMSTTNLQIDGAQVDAINYPNLNFIQLNGTTWNQLSSSDKDQLIIHEILGVARLKDNKYNTSFKLFEFARIGIDRNLGYQPCYEMRTMTGPQITKLALLLRPKASSKQKEINLSFECHTGINLQAFSFSRCEDWQDEDLSKSLIQIFEKLNVAKYTEGSDNDQIYSIDTISCNRPQSKVDYTCAIRTYWTTSCH